MTARNKSAQVTCEVFELGMKNGIACLTKVDEYSNNFENRVEKYVHTEDNGEKDVCYVIYGPDGTEYYL